MCLDLAVRIDLEDAFFCYFHFIFPYGLPGGVDLAVDIGKAYPVIVDEIQRTHAAPCQRLYRIAADTANAEYRHSRLRQPFHCRLFHQQFCS